ncbi:c-type cytochrome biogenesis protein CcmI [Marinimicrobium agarilyticum]|uniref:c-type cytochrome biogenesis protein CcmI n=1 Tax=Marinimicrobium agarilyticum TaxID=306546 RepID=UPI0004069956|nr:c-type cytochrome biogenesis protein CcmI [Marinimicrobium agarilyticum]
MMFPLWLAIALLTALALAFFLWPMRRKASGSHLERVRRHYLEANVALFREHLAELEAARDAGRLSPQAFEQLKLEQERALLEEERELATSRPTRGRALPGGRVLVMTALVLVVASVGFYRWSGSSEDVKLAVMRAEKAAADRDALANDRRINQDRTWELVEQLKRRVDEEPESTEYRYLLAYYFRELGHYDQAVQAYEEILEQQPGSPRIQAELAETLFIRDDNRLNARARTLVKEALASNPQETTALGLAGIDAFGQQNYRDAIDYWERAVAVMNPRSGNALAFQRGIERARQALGEEAPTAQPDADKAEGITIPVQVRLGEGVEYSGEERVFVYARAWQGSKMPLAIKTLQVEQLPTSITLDETMAMSPAASLASVNQVELVARLSKSGDASAQPGDWQGSLGPVDLSDIPDSLTLTIDEAIAE